MSTTAEKLYFTDTQAAGGRRAWIDIRLDHIVHNAGFLKSLLPEKTGIMAVLKADAYGHGAGQTGIALEKHGVSHFAVADLGEALTLRKSGVKGEILILGATPVSEYDLLLRHNLSQSLIGEDYARELARVLSLHTRRSGRKMKIHVKLDTGMGRLGEPWHRRDALRSIYAWDCFSVQGTFSHLSSADGLSEEDRDYTLSQIKRFFDTTAFLKASGVETGPVHLQSSYGILNYPGLPCAFARPGIALYGNLSDKTSSPSRAAFLKPALSLSARVVQVKPMEKDIPVGYGRHFRMPAKGKMAVIAMGYADGLPRSLSDRGGEVLIHGQRAPIAGRICMDYFMADVTHINEVTAGDTATLIGEDGDETIRAEDLAQKCGTITNELFSRLGSRLEKRYSNFS